MTDVLFEPLINTVLRVVAILVVATIVLSMMRRSSASLRALAWTAALTGTLVLPLVSLSAPSLEIAVLPVDSVSERQPFVEMNTTPMPTLGVTAERTTAGRATAAPTTAERTTAEYATVERSTAARTTVERATSGSDAPRTASVSAQESIARVAQKRTYRNAATAVLTWFTDRVSIAAFLAGAWLIGTLLLLARIALGHRRLGALVSSAGDASDDWHATVDKVRRELGIGRDVDVRTSRDIDIPAVAGVFVPVLLVPVSVDWSASAKRDVVLHELAHVARWDALAQLLSNLACAIYWFIPLTWYAARQAAALREQACDNVVLRSGTRPSLYAQRLLTFSNAPMSTALEPVALAMARPARIQRRLLDILDPNTRRTRLSASFTTAFMAASLGMVALIAIVKPVSASEPLAASRATAEPIHTAHGSPVVASVSVTGSAVALPVPSSVLTHTPATASVPSVHAVDSLTTASVAERTWSGIMVSPIGSTSAELPSPSAIALPSDFTVPVMVPTAAANVAAKVSTQQQTFIICRNGTKNHQIHSNSSGSSQTWRLTADGPGCDISIRIEGKPTFNRDFTDIERISGRGTFEIDVRQDGVRRELRIRDDDGRLARTYRIDGQERPYDAEAAAWFGQVLIAIDRQTAFAVDTRLPMLLERGGVSAVLAETRQIPSDYVRTTYYKALSKARRLTTQELASVLNQGAELTTSDYYATELLKGVDSQGFADPTVRDGVTRLISRMSSDYYKFESIKATVNAGRPTADEVGMLVDVVGKMTSDYYRAETVKTLTRTADLSSAQLNDVLSIASRMTSDHHINEMLGTVTGRGTLDTDKRIAYLTAARAIDSDHHRADAVSRLLRNGAPTTGEMDLLFTTVSEIDSDHYMGEVLDRLLSTRSLRETDLLRAEEVARRIDSDHTHAEVLRRIGSHAAATDAVRSAVHASAQSLGRHYRETVLRGVER